MVVALLSSGFIFRISKDSEMMGSWQEECEDRILKCVLEKECE